MELIGELLFILAVVLIIVLAFMHQTIPSKDENIELYVDKNNVNIKECSSSICSTMSKMQKNIDNTLRIVNRKPKDYNDKQNLNIKYNKGTYRDEKGMFRSLKTAHYEELGY